MSAQEIQILRQQLAESRLLVSDTNRRFLDMLDERDARISQQIEMAESLKQQIEKANTRIKQLDSTASGRLAENATILKELDEVKAKSETLSNESSFLLNLLSMSPGVDDQFEVLAAIQENKYAPQTLIELIRNAPVKLPSKRLKTKTASKSKDCDSSDS